MKQRHCTQHSSTYDTCWLFSPWWVQPGVISCSLSLSSKAFASFATFLTGRRHALSIVFRIYSAPQWENGPGNKSPVRRQYRQHHIRLSRVDLHTKGRHFCLAALKQSRNKKAGERTRTNRIFLHIDAPSVEVKTCRRLECSTAPVNYGDHVLYCERGSHRIRRHDAQVRLLAGDLAKAARHPIVEERPLGRPTERSDIRALGRTRETVGKLPFSHKQK